MPRNIVEPVTEQLDDLRGTRTTHPAFAQITASRMSGHSILYGSDFAHNNTIRISIMESELHRNLSNDRHYATRELISVELSEAQWASFVSSLNVGMGVPCTLTRVNQEGVPGLPLINKTDKFKAEVGAKLDKATAELDALMAAIDEMGLSKTKANAMKDRVRSARQQIADNLPFVVEQFDEHVEVQVEKAKIEVNAYMTSSMQQAGLASLQGTGPLLIEEKDD